MRKLAMAVLAQAVKDAIEGDDNAVAFLRGDDLLLRLWSDAAGVPLERIHRAELNTDLIASRLAIVRADARRMRELTRWSAID